MDDTRKLVGALKSAGLSDQAIRAAWPSWWNDDAAASRSGRAELRFALARKLGLSPKSLLGERVEFVWKNDTRFKNLTAVEPDEQAALASFGVAVGRLLLRATPRGRALEGLEAGQIRRAILQSRQVVDLLGLLSTCWGLGVPVIHLRIFPLHAKSMRAMVVGVDGRHAILLGRDSHYPAPLAFTLAHELGHAALGHAKGGEALVDIADTDYETADSEEQGADRFGLTLLTGTPRPQVTTNIDNYSARSLASEVISAGPPKRAIRAIEALASTIMAGARIASFEQFVTTVLLRVKFDAIRNLICRAPSVDRAVAICFSCSAATMSIESVLEGLSSYTRDLRKIAPTVLIASDDLSAGIL